MINKTDLVHLKRCIELAEEALNAGDKPFGSLLVSESGAVLFEDRNRTITESDATSHLEINIAKWAAKNLSPTQRANAVVYTSGEHCAMCSAAHGWVGLGKIIYASSSQQLSEWLHEFGIPSAPVKAVPIQQIVPNADVRGPVDDLAAQIRALHAQFYILSKNS